MAYEYIDQLAIDTRTKEKLRSLGAATPEALLSKLEFAPSESEEFLGPDEFSQAVEALRQQGTGGVSYPPMPEFQEARGAWIGAQPKLGVREQLSQDTMSSQIEELHHSGDTSPETQRHAARPEAAMKKSLKAVDK